MKKICTFFLFLCFWGSVAGQTPAATFREAPRSEEITRLNRPVVLYGTASYYADKFIGRPTATGATYSHLKLTAACNRLPLGTWIRVTNLRNNKTVVVEVNDRLHPKNKRVVDMSRIAAEQLGYTGRGLTQVKVEVLARAKTHKKLSFKG